MIVVFLLDIGTSSWYLSAFGFPFWEWKTKENQWKTKENQWKTKEKPMENDRKPMENEGKPMADQKQKKIPKNNQKKS